MAIKKTNAHEVADKVPSIFSKTEARDRLNQILLLLAH